MSNKILPFPEKNKQLYGTRIIELLQEIREITGARYGVLLLDQEAPQNVVIAVDGEPTPQEMVRLCATGIYDALSVHYRGS